MCVRFAALAVAIALVVAACSGATTSRGNAGASCASAGGFCTVAECAQQAPTSAQDCSPNGGFGGFYCCRRAEDAGSDDSGGGADANGQSCAERTADAHDALLAAASKALAADVSCTSDSDCTLASDNSVCGDGYGCGIVVNQAGAAALQAAIAKVNATTCAGFLADGCQPPIALPCAPLLPSCVAGACSDFPVPPSDDAGDAASDGAGE
jgi:hypothetical protein